MKNLIFPMILLCLSNLAFSETKQEEILYNLYKLIDNKETYVFQKEKKIAEIKKMLEVPEITQEQLYNINKQLHNEYKVFISDSATSYVKKNLNIATFLNNDIWIHESKIALSFLYSLSGKYFEALEILNEIDSQHLKQLPPWLHIEYYGAYKELYRYYSSLVQSNNNYDKYYFKSTLYRDSLLSIVNPETQFHKILCAEKYIDENDTEKAKKLLLDVFENTHTEDREKAILANVLANIFRKEGNTELEIQFYAISSICDIKNAIKENASMQSLASVLYRTGDIDHAYKCIKSSLDDAMFCNAYLRTFEVSNIFPIIDAAYQEKVSKQQNILKVTLLLVSILSLLLIIAVLYVYKQMKRVARIRKELYRTNIKLNELNESLQISNEQLHQTNDKLTHVNLELSETNLVKETYLGKFIDLCSNYIDKLDNYRRQLNKIAASGKIEALYTALKSSQFIDDELSNFYHNFDETFLHIYPSFIKEFNELFPDGEKQTPKQDELLTPELRIYALVRLGIQDSIKIASFLRYSITTVYTYRSKLRSKSLYKEDFEERVKKIGIYSI